MEDTVVLLIKQHHLTEYLSRAVLENITTEWDLHYIRQMFHVENGRLVPISTSNQLSTNKSRPKIKRKLPKHTKPASTPKPNPAYTEGLNSQLKRESEAKRREELEREQQKVLLKQRLEAELIAQKRAQGKAEVLCGSIVFVKDTEDDENLKFYLRLPQQWNYETGRMEYVDTPPADATPISCDANFSRGICGKFVGDEVSIEGRNGTILYRVLDVQPHSGLVQQQPENTKNESIPYRENDTYSVVSRSFCKIVGGSFWKPIVRLSSLV